MKTSSSSSRPSGPETTAKQPVPITPSAGAAGTMGAIAGPAAIVFLRLRFLGLLPAKRMARLQQTEKRGLSKCSGLAACKESLECGGRLGRAGALGVGRTEPLSLGSGEPNCSAKNPSPPRTSAAESAGDAVLTTAEGKTSVPTCKPAQDVYLKQNDYGSRELSNTTNAMRGNTCTNYDLPPPSLLPHAMQRSVAENYNVSTISTDCTCNIKTIKHHILRALDR